MFDRKLFATLTLAASLALAGCGAGSSDSDGTPQSKACAQLGAAPKGQAGALLHVMLGQATDKDRKILDDSVKALTPVGDDVKTELGRSMQRAATALREVLDHPTDGERAQKFADLAEKLDTQTKEECGA